MTRSEFSVALNSAKTLVHNQVFLLKHHLGTESRIYLALESARYRGIYRGPNPDSPAEDPIVQAIMVGVDDHTGHLTPVTPEVMVDAAFKFYAELYRPV